jgi:glycosyltransferase involved in cell wall biosynthesis
MMNCKVLIVTSEWPRYQGDITGIHVVKQVNNLREAGLDVAVFHFHGRKNPLFYLKAMLDFHRLPLNQYNVIHSHHGQSGLIALVQRRLPVVVTFHGSDLQGIFNGRGQITILGHILRITSRMVARLASERIVVSDHMARFLPPGDYHVIPIGVDLELFSERTPVKARRMLGLPIEKRLVLFVGDPARTEKRFWLASESMNLLQERMEVELIVVHGVLQEVMPLYLSACDALLITSISEGSPTIVKEALACNLPIVSTNVGDVKDRIGSVEGCILSENDRPETVAAALFQVLSCKKRIDGRQGVADLDEKLLTQKVINFYQKAAAKARFR